MKDVSKAPALLASLSLAALCLFVAAVSPAWPAQAPLIFNDPNTEVLPRVLSGKELGPLMGQSIAKVRLFADHGRGLEQIPFQIDEVGPGGVHLLDGVNASPPDEQPGAIDANDELVFLLADSGLKAHRGLWPGGAQVAQEIELSDQAGGRRGYVYALVFASPPPMTPARPIRYDAAKDEVDSEFMHMGFWDKAPFVFDWASIADFDKGKSINLVDRLKTRIQARAVGEMITININEEEVKGTLRGVRVGPVRVIRDVLVQAKIGPMPEIPLEVRFIFSPRTVQIPVSFQLPGAIRTFLTEMDMVLGVDFRDISGATLSTLAINRGTLVDGVLSPLERKVPLGDEEWFMITGRGLNVFAVIDLDRTLTLNKEVHFLDSLTDANPPEFVPGQRPEIGFRFLNWRSLEARQYRFDATIAALPGFPSGGGSGFYKAIHNPPAAQLSAGVPPRVVLVHAPGVPQATLESLERSLNQNAQGQLAGLVVERVGVAGSARESDLDRIAAKRPDLVVFLADANAGEVRNRIERRGSRAILATAGGGGGDPLDVPPDRVIAMIRQSVPEQGKVLLPTGSPATQALWGRYEEAARAGGVQLVHVPIQGADVGQVVADAARDAVGVLVLPDNYWSANNFGRLEAALVGLQKAGRIIPVFATSRAAVEHGAVLGLETAAGVSATALAGQALASLQGKAMERQADSQGASTTQFFVNMTALRAGRFRIPIQILKTAERIEPGG